MIQEEIARLTGKLVFQVDNRPLMAFEKRLNAVIGQLRQLETLANKKFNIKVQLDSRTLREQLAKATNAKVTLKDVDVSHEALALAAKRISDKLSSTPIKMEKVKATLGDIHVSPEAMALATKRISDKIEATPITLSKVRVDISSLVEMKKLIRTLVGQIDIMLPVKFQLSAADKALREWKKETEAKYKLKIDADISQHKFLSNVRKSLQNASMKLGPIKIDTPDIKLKIDREHLKQEIRDVLAQIRRETTIRVNLRDESPRRERAVADRSARGHAFGGGLMGAGMGFARGALPGLGAAFAIGAVNNINQQLVATNTALEAVSGSAEGYASNLKFLEQLTEEQGRNMRDVGPQFTSVLASAKASIGNEGVQDLFRGLTKYGTVMGLDQEAMKGSMRAISQMFSKDKIQAEEAQGQLAERLPAAMQLLAEANGTDVPGLRQAMQDGKLDPKKILPEMARIMEELADANGAYTKALQSTRVAQGRMNRQFERSVRIFAQGGFDKGMNDFFTTMATGMRDAEPLVKALGGAFEILMRPVNALIKIIGVIGKNWEKIAAVFGLTGKQLIVVGIAAATLVSPFLAATAAVAGLALVVEDLVGYAQGKDSLFGRFLDKYPEAKTAFDEFVKQSGILSTYLGQAWDYLTKVTGGLQGLSFPEMFTSTLRELSAIMEAINRMIDRFQMAGKYAEMKNPEGSTSRAMGGLQADNFEAMMRGADWARLQMEQNINREFNNNNFNQTPDGIPVLGPNMQALERWAERMLSIQDPQQATNMMGDVKLTIQVQGGIISSGDLKDALVDPVNTIVSQAFSNMIKSNTQTQSKVRQ